jgi:hypothetical protein
MTWATSIVGRAIYYQLRNLCIGQVYPSIIAQDATFPCISYSVVSVTPDDTKDSRSVADKVRVQVDIFDKSFDNANVIASLVRDQLDFISGTIAGVPIDTCRYDGEQHLFENEIRIHHIAQDYLVRIPNDSMPSNMQSIETITAVTGDNTALSIIPPGYAISMIIFDNQTGFTAQLSAGTASGGFNIFQSEAIDKNGLTTISPKNKTFSLTQFTSIYFNHAGESDTWGGATLTIYVCLTKVK